VDLTHSELARSREHLLQAEKMALVGKLAAGMAHSIRNPFTSVKMRLFSLSRSLNLSETQKDDFDVISEEIRHIDTIVQNFLEFSRPPKLKMQSISPSQVVDLVLKLLAYRLQSYDVQLNLERSAPLPEVQADPEQLKEVLVNIIVNACEAMQRGGTITILEEEVFDPSGRHLAVVCIRDTGPGIPHAIQSKIFQPFFTTKDDGTGLGLSIASRIIEDHRGKLEAYSQDGNGTTFTLTLPIEEPIDEQEHHSGH
jgi:signal transduction histidine kinase